MIEFSQAGITYAGNQFPTFADLSFTISEGELCLVIGPTGSGKSTLLNMVNGLVPHSTGGILTGQITVAGYPTHNHPPRELAHVVGVVGQDPLASFVTDNVEDELAYTMESLGMAPEVMRRRVEDVLDVLSLAEIRHRPLRTLSHGQQQRVAIGAVLTVNPQVLVLDEPTSALDPSAAEEVLAVIHRLVHDLGLTVLMSEHRLERVVHYADRIMQVNGQSGNVSIETPVAAMKTATVYPPIVALGRLANWEPLPLSIRDARRMADPLRRQLSGPSKVQPPLTNRPTAITVADLMVRYGNFAALHGIHFSLNQGEITVLMGRNGAGKTTLLRCLAGLQRQSSGVIDFPGVKASQHKRSDERIGFVPQQPTDLLFRSTVDSECQTADRDARLDSGATYALLNRLAPDINSDLHPRDLSEGQRLALALAIVLAENPAIVLLDEPTRGLDYAAKTALRKMLRQLARNGHAVLLATHDVEFAAETADQAIVLADGEIVAHGPSAHVVTQSPAFAPQVSKVLGSPQWLTVSAVKAALQS